MEQTIYSAPTNKTKRRHILLGEYLEVADIFHWAEMRHFKEWFAGSAKRHGCTERNLPKLVRSGRLRVHKLGKNKLIYSLPRKSIGFKGIDDLAGFGKVKHGLGCTECIVRIYRSDTNVHVYPERVFKNIKPEAAFKYPSGKILFLEFSTEDNFHRSGLIRGKMAAYRNSLSNLEEQFEGNVIVLFVNHVDRSAVERKVGSVGGVPPLSEGTDSPSPFFFTDYETFKKVPIGEALTAPIYFWADGKQYPLRKNA